MRIAFVTGSRADWRLVEPLLAAARHDGTTDPRLIVTGTHLSPRHGHTLSQIQRSGWLPAARVKILEDHDTPEAVARATGRAITGCADALAAQRPDWTVVVGDRYESFAAGVAATMLGIPLAHIGGGETDIATNQDCNLRNALSKLAQLHFVAHDLAAARLRALGEEEWRIHTTGLPSIDTLLAAGGSRAAWADLRPFGIHDPARPLVLASFLPVTLRPTESRAHLSALLAALGQLDAVQVLFVLSNGDADGDGHDAAVRAWAGTQPHIAPVAALPADLYQFVLRNCACYVGNSSSGVIEAPVYGTPVVIVGCRQDGRPRAQNVRDVPDASPRDILSAITSQLRHGRYTEVASPWGDGRAAPRILRRLHAARSTADLMSKRLSAPVTGPSVVEERACALLV